MRHRVNERQHGLARTSPVLVLLLLIVLATTPTGAWVGTTTTTTSAVAARSGGLLATSTRTIPAFQPHSSNLGSPSAVAVPRRRRTSPVALASLASPPAEPASSSLPPGNSTATTASSSALAADTIASASHHVVPPNGEAGVAPAAAAGGRVLEGGKVIDFSNTKASDRAEMALRQARNELLERQKQQQQQRPDEHSSFPVNGHVGTMEVNGGRASSAILGVNQDVIDLVGHELGAFATAQEIQDCAAYLRSNAPPGMLRSEESETSSSSTPSYTSIQLERFRRIMDQAYFEAGEVTSAYAKTFYMGTMLLPIPARQAIWAVYVWCRRTDEIVDAPRNDDKQMLLDLSAWELRLENLFERGTVEDVYDLVLLDCRIQYPTMDITPYMDMIRGMLMDVPDLGQDRYDKFDELHLYCYRVAGTVGLMSLPIFGCAHGYDDETAREPALSLGVAFQLTNILRDVGEDAVKRGRVYLPQEDLERFGVTEDQIFEQRVDERYVNLMRFEIARARMYYERARRGVFMLAPESRLPVQSSLDAYGRILDKIEQNGYDSLNKRAYVDKWEKLSIIPSSWYRTLDISKILPLPGDKPVLMDRI